MRQICRIIRINAVPYIYFISFITFDTRWLKKRKWKVEDRSIADILLLCSTISNELKTNKRKEKKQKGSSNEGVESVASWQHTYGKEKNAKKCKVVVHWKRVEFKGMKKEEERMRVHRHKYTCARARTLNLHLFCQPPPFLSLISSVPRDRGRARRGKIDP